PAPAPLARAFPLPEAPFNAKARALRAAEPAVMAIKLNGNFPTNPTAHGLPTVQGIIYLADAANGRPLALMDSIEVTINRTGAATTLAARQLARPDSRVATICGAGVQGRIQLRAIAAALPLVRVHVWDARPEAARAMTEEVREAVRCGRRAADGRGVVAEGDVVATCSRARRASLGPAGVRPAPFTAAAGAKNPNKQEIDPRLYAAGLAVVDSL